MSTDTFYVVGVNKTGGAEKGSGVECMFCIQNFKSSGRILKELSVKKHFCLPKSLESYWQVVSTLKICPRLDAIGKWGFPLLLHSIVVLLCATWLFLNISVIFLLSFPNLLYCNVLGFSWSHPHHSHCSNLCRAIFSSSPGVFELVVILIAICI